MKTIDTLVSDIQDLLVKGVTFSKEEELDLGHKIAGALNDSFGNREYTPGLRMSKFGSPCELKLWLQDHPDSCGDTESLSAPTRLKFADALWVLCSSRPTKIVILRLHSTYSPVVLLNGV